ncbi:MLO-like protein 4 [Camellia lanceoleosa]|uniref:MLO-like protein 4 n=1 Tax=Camellia lanceoleosa TaxID=1840588 RepID=A0ACC0IS02_9ERIC|nr:MLO-like protein 4 [Camellia lanceoleosa]
MASVISLGRSLEETPTWAVASVTTVMVFVCLLVERSIYRFGKWLKKTRRKALFASLEKIKEELMLLGLISLMLGQWAGWISQICVNSSLFSSRFYLCSEEDYGKNEKILLTTSFSSLNGSDIPPGVNYPSSHQCGEGREPFVSYEGLEQLHRFLFVLGVTHVLYSCVVVGLAMSKIYSWRKWENQASLALDANLQAKVNKVMKRQSTFVLHHASHPWSRSRVLIWMLCFLQQFKSPIQKSDYLALRLGFITNHKLPHSYNFHRYVVRSMEDEFYGIVGISWPLWGYAILCIFINIHGSNIYFWLSFIPAILVMLVGTKLQHVVSLLALETLEPRGQPTGAQVKPRDELFWFGKPEILLWLIQFISFQNAFEMATFIWSLWGFKQRSCFMDNHAMIIIRLISGVLVQFWCSYSTVPLNVLITQMGSKCKKAVIAESVRESLHSWCKRVRARSKRDALHSLTTRSTCSLESIIDERDEIITVGSGILSRSSSIGTLDHVELNVTSANEQLETFFETSIPTQHELSFQIPENPSETVADGAEDDNYLHGGEGGNGETLFELFQKTR